GDLIDAFGKWLKRSIDVDDLAGQSSTQWNIVSEGEPDGRYVIAIDNVKVIHADGTVDTIYENGKSEQSEQAMNSGYTKFPALIVAERGKIKEGGDIEPTIALAEKVARNKRKLEALESELDLIERFVKDKPTDQHTKEHILQARVLLNSLYKLDEITSEQIEAAMHLINHAADHAHPEMKKYTGHLVGHAHIDLQWLWEWQEGIVASHDTFNQAVKFMDEFPGFTFSQSSSVIYKAVEEAYPDLFKKVQGKVKSGKWEVVGGRVCEGDTNMISPESHVRQFLYGQKYFREKFGKTATVGWEPDTFGHTAQMPQILKLGGCKYYYFCRGGKNKPLFWWEALDGTKILTFDEPATDSWYNGDIGYKQFQEMLNFEKNNGSKDMLWVYGVGNHGGGPTREMLNEALKLQSSKNLPQVKFSTATEFFKKLETYDLTKIPNIKSELNPVFDGCYTTHSEVKQLNRQAENALATSETISAMASNFGFAYPAAQFRAAWEDVCFNHHHDTLPGSGIHSTYEKSKITLGRAVSTSMDTTQRAMETLSLRLTPMKGGMSFVVANPLGWKRSEWVETWAVPSGWDSQSMRLEDLVAVAPDGTQSRVEVVDTISKRVRFWAGDVPSFGYKVFQLKNGRPVAGEKLVVDGNTISGSKIRAVVDSESGGFKELSIGNHSYTNVGRLENHYERPGGMSAWQIAPIASVSVWKPSSTRIVQGANEVKVIFDYSIPSLNRPTETTTARQTFVLRADQEYVNTVVDCDWHHVGSA
ncbi:MAG TPA: hypothetical protein VK171_10380, partial [Fimbriimonas sp.]|nr:hypothetical protein [Fimbriimonas sp.]